MILIIYLDLLDNTFEKYNYKDFQPFIKIFGKNIIEWILDYLRLDIFNKCIILYNNQILNFNFNFNFNKYNINFIYKYINEKSNIINTLLEIFDNKEYNIDESILYIDTKNFYTKNTFFINSHNTIFYKNEDVEGNLSNKNFYININQNENIVNNILSNNKISNNLVVGSFIFNSLFEFKKYCKKICNFNDLFFLNNISIINLINLMLFENIIFYTHKLTNNDIISLETPFHIRLFCNNFPKISALNNDIMIPNKKISINLNCIFEITNKNILSYTPNNKNIIFIKYLKNIGNTIIIITSLEDNEYNKKNLIEILSKNNIIYDSIHYNLPETDFYIDYKNILLDNNIEKNLGFYKNKIESRDFNDVICKDIKTYKKISDDLSGEIYYYKNIPSEIKDIFPIMFNYDKNNKWYEMENINGIPISKLYLNEELTLEQFNHVLKTINRIHSCNIDKQKKENYIEDLNLDISFIDIYENYINKIKNRYEKYDYTKFNNSKIIYNYLIKELDIYEKKKLGKLSIIHGDTVFTNILINNFGKIKLIDMRGIINKTLTIYGDKMYDYAKIYQSLLGYDEILDNKYVSIEYKNKFLNYFEERFLNIYTENDFYYLKIITASLLFTLIPLHNNDKCNDYYNLIYKLNIKY
jgi:tRNA A-37 threonylcarbamoyl transferase component Bud32